MSFKYASIPNLLTKEECDLILKFSLENLTLKPAGIVGEDKLILDKRKSNVAFYPYYEKFPFILKKINKLLEENISIKGFDLDYKNSDFQFTEYKLGEYYGWHVDSDGEDVKQNKRYCSLVIQLNDGYTGGELQIKDKGDNEITLEGGLGNLFLFYSHLTHRVTPIISGTRYSLVNWFRLTTIENFQKTLI